MEGMRVEFQSLSSIGCDRDHPARDRGSGVSIFPLLGTG
jgi:hypothetical protein